MTTFAPTTGVSDLDFLVDPIDIVVSMGQPVLSYSVPAPINPNLDTYYEPDPIEITLSIEGSMLNVGIVPEPIEIEISIEGDEPNVGKVITDCVIPIVVSLSFTDYLLGQTGSNFVKWSKIGELDFTIDETNLAGERPMDWKGAVYAIRKLAKALVVYGANGVTVMSPTEVHWGMETIYRIGVKNKGAVAGDDSVHFFVDNLGQLWQLGQSLEKLDYSEFLSTMTGTIILSYDIEKKLLYICNGTVGYVYGVETKSFGEGPVNIAGVHPQAGTLYVVSDGEIETPSFEICTDIYDFGTRKPKTIQSIEVGSDLTEFLYASIDYRTSYRDSFKQIGWFLVNPGGKSFPKCYGVEFRFRLKSTIYEYFELDYLKIRGHIHGYSYLDMAYLQQ